MDVKELKICSDCYEQNEDFRTTCIRCGRQLEEARQVETTPSKFETQHADAPNVMRSDRSVYRR